MTEVSWLVERADPKNERCVMPNSFLGFRGTYPAGRGGYLDWVENARDALRFSRREDAEKLILGIENLQEQRIYSLTLPGLRSGDVRAIAVEHAWG